MSEFLRLVGSLTFQDPFLQGIRLSGWAGLVDCFLKRNLERESEEGSVKSSISGSFDLDFSFF